MAQLMSIKKNVDVQPGVGVPAIFHCSQGDKGTRIILGLLNNNDSYTIPEGTTAIIRGSRADGTLFTEITADIDTTTEIKFNLTEDMTSIAGPVECEAVMTSGSANVIGTANFIVNVEKSPASIGSVLPGTDAATTWLIDKLENEPINELNGESVVDAINGGSGSGLTEDVKTALLACFEKVAWIDEDGQDYYDALYSALYPPADLVSISAVYTQSGTVYDNQTLDSLRSNLVVTAHMSDSSTQTVTTYLLSGTLATGTSTITVSYGGKVTAFNVTVTHATVQYTITNSLTNCTNSNSATVINEETSYSGTLSATSGYIMATISIVMGSNNITATSYDSETGAISIASVTGNIVITAEAVEDVGWISGVPYSNISFTTGYMIGNDGSLTENASYSVTDYLPCKGVDCFINAGLYQNYRMYFYDENKDPIGWSIVSNVRNASEVTPPFNAAFVKSYCRVGGENNVVITPYNYPELTETTVWQEGQRYVPTYEHTGGTSYMSGYGLIFGATTGYFSDKEAYYWVYFYDADKNDTSNVRGGSSATSFSIPEGTYYARFLSQNKKGFYWFE